MTPKTTALMFLGRGDFGWCVMCAKNNSKH